MSTSKVGVRGCPPRKSGGEVVQHDGSGGWHLWANKVWIRNPESAGSGSNKVQKIIGSGKPRYGNRGKPDLESAGMGLRPVAAHDWENLRRRAEFESAEARLLKKDAKQHKWCGKEHRPLASFGTRLLELVVRSCRSRIGRERCEKKALKQAEFASR